MKPVLTADEYRRVDKAYGGDLIQAMDKAGYAVALAAARAGASYGKRVVVLAGPGNNGGDGYVAARYLKARGVDVEMQVLARPKTAEAIDAANKTRAVGVRIVELRQPDNRAVVIDALFGGGARDANPVRALLINLGTGLDYSIFGDSPNPSKVLLGKNGWLYGRKAIEGLCQPGSPFASVQDLLEVVALLRGQGVVVIFTVAPAKFTIHPENLTEVQSELAQCARRSSELFRSELSAAADPGYIDSWAIFETMKSMGISPYFRTDTHFNEWASIMWVEAIVTRIQPGIWEEGAVKGRGDTFFIGNLMRLMGRGEFESVNGVLVDRGFPWRPIEQLHDRFSDSQTATERLMAGSSESKPLIGGRVLVLKDSL